MTYLQAQPITAADFAPFGAVIDYPQQAGKAILAPSLGNLRDYAQPDLTISHITTVASTPLTLKFMERHEFSSQTFMPLQTCSYLVVVAPHNAAGMPDMAQAKAFLVNGQQSITYHPNTWHYSLTLLEGPGTFGVWMWKADDGGDEEFVDIDPVKVHV
jgi:ureidoglycolate lyase